MELLFPVIGFVIVTVGGLASDPAECEVSYEEWQSREEITIPQDARRELVLEGDHCKVYVRR